MIKRLYLANGHLLQPLELTSDDIAVDTGTAVLLETNLTVGDYCYLTLIDGAKLEVIKISRDYSGYQVDRAQDGTARAGFSLDTRIIYKLTSAEIRDVSIPQNWNLYGDGYGLATVSGSGTAWDINLSEVRADTVGGIEAYSENNELVINDKAGMFGCCDDSVTGAPFIDGPFFYLTTMLYPQEVVDAFTPQPKDRNGNAIPPINFSPTSSWWLLTQPSTVEQYISNSISTFDWQQYGSAGSFTTTEQYVNSAMSVGVYAEWAKYGGEKAFTAPIEQYIGTNCYPLEMLAFGSEVVYDRALDMYLQPKISLLDWTLL